VSELRNGIERAASAVKSAVGDSVLSDPWDEVVSELDAALKSEAAGDKQATLQHADVAAGRLRVLAMMGRGISFENTVMEDARLTALRALDSLPRSI
jgi:hypothetical protein